MYKSQTVLQGYEKLDLINKSINEEIVNKILSKLGSNNYYRILDIGCGLSPLLPLILKNLNETHKTTVSYTGIDTSTEMLEKATEMNSKYIDEFTQITYVLASADQLNVQTEFGWYNIVIIQNFVHLILNKNELESLMKYVSKVLINEGVFYISTKTTIKTVKNLHDDVYLVKKNHDNSFEYERRIFTDDTFKSDVLSVFVQEKNVRS